MNVKDFKEIVKTKEINFCYPGTPSKGVVGIGLMMKAMLSGTKGNIRICTDMTEDEGYVIDKSNLQL
jgi:hypothetical protein